MQNSGQPQCAVTAVHCFNAYINVKMYFQIFQTHKESVEFPYIGVVNKS